MSQAKKNNRRNYSQIDKEVMDLILKDTKEYIENLEDQIELSRNKALKSISRLEKKGKIRTEKVMHSGKWTTQILLVENYGLDIDKKVPDTPMWETLGNLPCFTCPEIHKCSKGIGSAEDGEANPYYCDFLSDWIDKIMANEEYDKIFQPDFEEIKKKKRRRRKKDED